MNKKQLTYLIRKCPASREENSRHSDRQFNWFKIINVYNELTFSAKNTKYERTRACVPMSCVSEREYVRYSE